MDKNNAILFFEKSRKDPWYFIKKVRWLDRSYTKEEFVKFKTLTHQQTKIIDAVKDWVNWGIRKITIASWHWIWKSTICAMLIIRYLFCFKDSQVPTTAPTAPLLQDILRKEINNWIKKMPEPMQAVFDPTSDYIRIKDNPSWRFARARTWKKETPEALAWVHADFVLLLADEASWVANEVFEASKWSLSWPNKLFILIGNPTRSEWYFYDTHHKHEWWNRLQFSSAESPIVDHTFVKTIIDEYWEDSDEYRIRVLWMFPREDAIDDKWFIPLITKNDIRNIPIIDFQPFCLWIDIAWEWKDETIRVLRDNDVARIIAREKISNPLGIATKTKQIIDDWNLNSADCYLDFFWIWANTSIELTKMWIHVTNVSVWDKAMDSNRFLNLRAELYWRLKEWLAKWAKLMWTWRDDILMNKYKRNERWLLKMMSKEDLRKVYWKSPDVSDALMLTMIWEEDMSLVWQMAFQKWA